MSRPDGALGLAARLQFGAAWLLVRGLGLLPRRAALGVGERIGLAFYALMGGLRRTGRRNLELAFPEMPSPERERLVRACFLGLGRLLGLFSHFPNLRPGDGTLVYENRHLLDAALAEGRGVLLLTGHVGGWEVGPFCLRLDGSPPVSFLVRRIDNPLVERMADRYRTLHGNRTIDKRNAARAVLEALRRGEMVGILADLNSLENEGVFVDFFGRSASTTAGVARLALRSNAVVLPGFTRWDARRGCYVLRFEPPIDLLRTGSTEEDVRANTQRFTKVIEEQIRQHPEQWLWIHKRWKTRPPGERGIY